MESITITNREDAVCVVPKVVGFQPENSLVFLGLGGNGMAGRVDIAEPDVMEEVFARVQHQMSPQVIVICYTDDEQLASRIAGHVDDIFSTPEVVDCFRYYDGNVYDPMGLGMTGTPVEVDGSRTRADLVAAAALIVDVAEAIESGVNCWRAGNGAKAWTLLDRAVELGTLDPQHLADIGNLNTCLLEAIPPYEHGDPFPHILPPVAEDSP